ncbi:hypothetical protein CIG75_16490 [Tumebacillus algifaecis]|uniref:DUF6602 domain-containing protein n=1 Tax=Tumebacillus algifaecis TaxID=1214604 RepID=A0A223D4W7_9BACL|nr:DUF6602 domain-containing protein [Tumebacillus algifaecis]ASS76394.1 hypothetical protein CIG75_16490 [Tumebacillus algifaecis]
MEDLWALFYEGIKSEQNVNFVELAPFREQLANFLLVKMPAAFAGCRGQVFSLDGTVSEMCDLVIYDRLKTPQLRAGKQEIIPAETTGAVVQTLEVLTAGLLVEEAHQIRSVRQLRKMTKKGYTGGLELMNEHPYTLGLIVARTSELTLDEIASVLADEQSTWPLAERISGVFVLDVGLVVYQTSATGEVRYFPSEESTLGPVAAGADTLAFLFLYLSSYLNSIEIIAPNLMPLLPLRPEPESL